MTVIDIMSTSPSCCTLDATLREVAGMMIDNDCGCIPVVESPTSLRVAGVITDRDIVCRGVAEGLDPNATLVSACMSYGVISVKAGTDLHECLRLMEIHQVRRMPVVNENGSIIGMVAQADIARACRAQDVAELVQDVSRPYLA